MSLSRRNLFCAGSAVAVMALVPGMAAASRLARAAVSTHIVGPTGWNQEGTSPVNTPVNMLGRGGIRVWDTGCTWRRLETSKGVFDWSRLDGEMSAWKAAGVTDILFTLGQPPDWATAPNAGSGSYNPYPVNNPQDSADFVTALLTRYNGGARGKITALEHANEPENGTTFYNGTPAQLAAVSKAQADAARAVDPTVVMVGACPQSFADKAAYLGLYLRALTAIGAAGAIDVVAAHTYVMPRQPEDVRKIIDLIKGQMNVCGYGSKPLWITECGWGGITSAPAGSGYYDINTGALVYLDGSVMSQAQAAAYLTRMYLVTLSGGADRLYFYADDKPFSAIRVINFTDKTQVLQSGLALQYFANIVASGTLSNYRQNGTLRSASFSTAGRHGGKVYWTEDRTPTRSVPVPAGAIATDVFGSPVSIIAGNITAGFSPVFVWSF